MSLLKKGNWLLYALVTILSIGGYTFYLAYEMDLFDQDEWYYKWEYWTFATLACILPAIIMLLVLNIQMAIKISVKFNTAYQKIYNTPYSWILCLIIPVLGWSTLIVMLIHVYLYPAVMIHAGVGDKYLKEINYEKN